MLYYVLKLLFVIITLLVLQGCGPLTIAATTVSGVMVAQEVEDEYDGNFGDYVEDKANTTYEYIERKTTE